MRLWRRVLLHSTLRIVSDKRSLARLQTFYSRLDQYTGTSERAQGFGITGRLCRVLDLLPSFRSDDAARVACHDVDLRLLRLRNGELHRRASHGERGGAWRYSSSQQVGNKTQSDNIEFIESVAILSCLYRQLIKNVHWSSLHSMYWCKNFSSTRHFRGHATRVKHSKTLLKKVLSTLKHF